MSAINFLEELAGQVHYSSHISERLGHQSEEVQNAFSEHRSQKLNNYLSGGMIQADGINVILP